MISIFNLDELNDEDRQKLTERSKILENSIVERIKEMIIFVKTSKTKHSNFNEGERVIKFHLKCNCAGIVR